MGEQASEGRRKFFRDCGRWIVALGLGGGVAALIERDPEKCVNRGICSGCAELDDCRLPQALSAKQSKDSNR
jgi:hypothetical protein